LLSLLFVVFHCVMFISFLLSVSLRLLYVSNSYRMPFSVLLDGVDCQEIKELLTCLLTYWVTCLICISLCSLTRPILTGLGHRRRPNAVRNNTKLLKCTHINPYDYIQCRCRDIQTFWNANDDTERIQWWCKCSFVYTNVSRLYHLWYVQSVRTTWAYPRRHKLRYRLANCTEIGCLHA